MLQAYKQRMDWSFPWTSSFGSDFNYDFQVTFTEEQQSGVVEYNFRADGYPQRLGDPRLLPSMARTWRRLRGNRRA